MHDVRGVDGPSVPADQARQGARIVNPVDHAPIPEFRVERSVRGHGCEQFELPDVLPTDLELLHVLLGHNHGRVQVSAALPSLGRYVHHDADRGWRRARRLPRRVSPDLDARARRCAAQAEDPRGQEAEQRDQEREGFIHSLPGCGLLCTRVLGRPPDEWLHDATADSVRDVRECEGEFAVEPLGVAPRHVTSPAGLGHNGGDARRALFLNVQARLAVRLQPREVGHDAEELSDEARWLRFRGRKRETCQALHEVQGALAGVESERRFYRRVVVAVVAGAACEQPPRDLHARRRHTNKAIDGGLEAEYEGWELKETHTAFGVA